MDLGNSPPNVARFSCQGCVEEKQARKSFLTNRESRANKVLELVHIDECLPIKTLSMVGAKYFLIFIDDFSKKVWLYLLKSKRQVLDKFKEWKTLVEKQSEQKIKVLRSDNGGEYISKAFDVFLHKHGIARETSAPYTPQQNRVAERANRTIVEMGRSMMHAQRLGLELWVEAMSNVCPQFFLYMQALPN